MTKRILIIDDEPLVGRLLRRALKGNTVTHVQSAEVGLERIATEQYDLVLCDLSMPHMSGMDLYENVRSRGDDTAERIVFMTGGVFTSDAVRFIERVPNETLDKPFDLARVRALVSEIEAPVSPQESTRPRARPLARADDARALRRRQTAV